MLIRRLRNLLVKLLEFQKLQIQDLSNSIEFQCLKHKIESNPLYNIMPRFQLLRTFTVFVVGLTRNLHHTNRSAFRSGNSGYKNRTRVASDGSRNQ